jgi:hypothetical protein
MCWMCLVAQDVLGTTENKPDRKVMACDYSQNMINTAVQFRQTNPVRMIVQLLLSVVSMVLCVRKGFIQLIHPF